MLCWYSYYKYFIRQINMNSVLYLTSTIDSFKNFHDSLVPKSGMFPEIQSGFVRSKNGVLLQGQVARCEIQTYRKVVSYWDRLRWEKLWWGWSLNGTILVPERHVQFYLLHLLNLGPNCDIVTFLVYYPMFSFWCSSTIQLWEVYLLLHQFL